MATTKLAHRVPRYEAISQKVLDFMRLLWAVDHALNIRSKRMARTLGVTGPQRLVIRMLGSNPGASAGEVAQMLRTHPSTLSGVLRRLETQGLIERQSDTNDRRRALFRLTRKGRKIDSGTEGTVEEAVARLIADTPRGRIVAASSVLASLARELDLEREPRRL